jgi:hypothetical protein
MHHSLYKITLPVCRLSEAFQSPLSHVCLKHQLMIDLMPAWSTKPGPSTGSFDSDSGCMLLLPTITPHRISFRYACKSLQTPNQIPMAVGENRKTKKISCNKLAEGSDHQPTSLIPPYPFLQIQFYIHFPSRFVLYAMIYLATQNWHWSRGFSKSNKIVSIPDATLLVPSGVGVSNGLWVS